MASRERIGQVYIRAGHHHAQAQAMVTSKTLQQIVIKPHQLAAPHKVRGRVIAGKHAQGARFLDLLPVTQCTRSASSGNQVLFGKILVQRPLKFFAVPSHRPRDSPATVSQVFGPQLRVVWEQDLGEIAVDDCCINLAPGHTVEQFILGNRALEIAGMKAARFCGLLLQGLGKRTAFS